MGILSYYYSLQVTLFLPKRYGHTYHNVFRCHPPRTQQRRRIRLNVRSPGCTRRPSSGSMHVLDTADDEGENPHHRACTTDRSIGIDRYRMRTRSYLRQSAAKPSLESPRPFGSFLSESQDARWPALGRFPARSPRWEVRPGGQFARFIEINGGSNSY